MTLSETTLSWLLEETDPSVRYRTLSEIAACPEDSAELLRLKPLIGDSQPVQTLYEKMDPDGYWLQKNPRTQTWVGEGVEYGSFATTHFVLAYLAELGADRSIPWVDRAAKRYLSLQQEDGDWWNHYSCLIGYNIRTFTLLGYRDNEHVERALDLLLNTDREDGGYLCPMHEGKYKTRSVKSCIRGSVKALLAFAEYPELWNHPRVLQLVDYFLRRGGIYKSNQPGEPVNDDMLRLSFPITWRSNGWEILYGLSKMGYGRDARLASAWEAFEHLADSQGRYSLGWTPTQSPWKVGSRGELSKWITFYISAAMTNNRRWK
jgi:hypothetical protein